MDEDSPSKRAAHNSRIKRANERANGIADGDDNSDVGSDQDIWELSKEEAIQRILELETELFEFQESSKDLEQALEDELHTLELNNEKLEYKYKVCFDQLNLANEKVAQLTKELNKSTDEHNKNTENLNQTLSRLKSQLISIEIANDSMETNDRVLANKLDISQQFNGELLEKIAILENDYERERKNGIEAQLFLSNAENEIRQLKAQIERQEKAASVAASSNGRQPNGSAGPPRAHSRSHSLGNHHRSSWASKSESSANVDGAAAADEEAGNVSILSMRDILKAGPPISRVPAIPKSNSLKRLHELTEKSGALSEKVQNFKTALVPGALKSPSTTQLSKMNSLKRIGSNGSRKSHEEKRRLSNSSARSSSSSKGRISPSPSIMNLAQVSKGAKIQDSSMRLHTIEGSPAKPENETATATKKTRKGSILDSLKSMGL